MSEVKYIELVFENCEEVRIDRKDIGCFWCTDVCSTIARYACNSIDKKQFCKELYIEISPDANKQFVSFGKETGRTIFQRIQEWNDITHIAVYYEDGTDDYIALEWGDNNDFTNTYQSSVIGEFGSLHVLVSQYKKVEEVANDVDKHSSHDSWKNVT